MTFATIPFIVYFLPIVLSLYYLLSFSSQAQNILLFLASLVFYAWNSPKYWLLLVLVTLINSLISYAIDRAEESKRDTACMVGVAINLVLLVFYRHLGRILGFFVPAIQSTWFYSHEVPMGIVVFTMNAIGYLFDVRNREIAPMSPFDVGITIAMFPFVSQGPVQSAAFLSQQLRGRTINLKLVSLGACRFVVGLAKVCLLVGGLKGITNNVFSLATIDATEYSVPATLSWLATVSCAMQVYYELSGVSDMAIGLGQMLGFHLLENFDYPFTAVSLSDFWRRWNTSVMRWMRRYIEKPLYGEKNDSLETGRAHLLSFVFIGMWHGQGLTFVLWGAINGIMVLLEQMVPFHEWIPRWAARAYTLLFVALGMVVYRSQDFYQVSRYILDMFCLNHNPFYTPLTWLMIRENWPALVLGLFFLTPIARKINQMLLANPTRARIATVPYVIGMVGLFFACIVTIVTNNYFPML